MCGRFTLTIGPDEAEELLAYYGVQPLQFDLVPRYNIAPMQEIVAVISDGAERRIGRLKWGLVPIWAKDPAIGNKMINARAETLLEKPAFKRLVARKRCLIPADGFYEWQRNQDGSKQPMRILLREQRLFSFAGLYDTWVAPSGEKLHTCTIITTHPNELMKPIHDRMPVILTGDSEQVWLDRTVQDPLLLQSFMRPYPAEQMQAYPVHQRVGNVRNDTPDCIEAM